jgi:hypothetical protein
MVNFRPKQRTGHLLNFYLLQLIFNAKMNFSRLMLVYGGLIMLAAYFCHSPLSQVEYNSALIKVDWLAACIALRVVGVVLVVFLRRWRKICTILQPMGSKGRYPEEMSKTLLTNEKQGNLH